MSDALQPEDRWVAVRSALAAKPFALLTTDALDTKADAILSALDALPPQPTDEAVRGLVKQLGAIAEIVREDGRPAAADKITDAAAEIARLQALTPKEG